jgi:hypothetical protein
MDLTLEQLEEQLGNAATRLLPYLRTSKLVDSTAMADLLDVTDSIRASVDGADLVPRRLTGTMWFIFTSMLTEAAHARSPAPILEAAWNYEDKLRRIFGPTF